MGRDFSCLYLCLYKIHKFVQLLFLSNSPFYTRCFKLPYTTAVFATLSNSPSTNEVTTRAVGENEYLIQQNTTKRKTCAHYDVIKWKHFSALLVLCAGNSPVTGEFLAQKPVTRSFVVFFDLRLNKRLSKQSWGCWFETTSCSLWRHCNVILGVFYRYSYSTRLYKPRRVYIYIYIYHLSFMSLQRLTGGLWWTDHSIYLKTLSIIYQNTAFK